MGCIRVPYCNTLIIYKKKEKDYKKKEKPNKTSRKAKTNKKNTIINRFSYKLRDKFPLKTKEESVWKNLPQT